MACDVLQSRVIEAIEPGCLGPFRLCRCLEPPQSIALWRPNLEIVFFDDFLWCSIAYRHHHHHLHSHHLWSSPCPTYRRNPQWASLLLWWLLLTWHTSPAESGYNSKSASTSAGSVTSRRRLAPVAIPSGFWRQTAARNAGLAKLGENRATRIKKSSGALHGCICVRSAL